MSHVGRLPEIGLSWLALLYVVLYEAYGGHLLLKTEIVTEVLKHLLSWPLSTLGQEPVSIIDHTVA